MKHRILAALGRRLRDRVARRPPDVMIGGDETRYGCYMARWHLLPRNRWFNLYLHHFQHSDDDRAHHDHPYASASFLIEGRYYEHIAGTVSMRSAGELIVRGAEAAHRISLPIGEHIAGAVELACWSIFATGPRVRNWGFLCKGGWMRHQDFIARGGCGEP